MVIIAILMLVSFVVACIQYKAIAAPILQGDANLDNAVNMADVIYIENVILNLAIRSRKTFCSSARLFSILHLSSLEVGAYIPARL